MREETIKIYQFDELSEKAKEKAVENERNSDGYLCDTEWAEFLEEEFMEELEKINISCDGFCWDLCGGYLYLDNPTIIDIKDFIKKMGGEKWLVLKALENKTDDDKDEFEDDLASIEIVSEQYKTIVGNFTDDEVGEQINQKLKDILDGFLKELQDTFSALNSDEEIINHLKINEFEFIATGERYYDV